MTATYRGGELVAEIVRSGFAESFHRGSVAVTDPTGARIAAIGDADNPVFPRSSNKPMQALAMLRAGWEPASEADLAIAQLRKALDAFARLDTAKALEVLKQDDQIDQEFEGLMRKLITFMMEDPRTISSSIDLVFVAKAIERVGDHAKNLAEQIIYIVKGTDVRHNSVVTVESLVR